MALADTTKKLKSLLEHVAKDLVKAEKGNRAASQRVRTGTIKLEKCAKMFRKESVKASRGGKKKKAAKKKAPAKRKKAAKRKAPARKKKTAKRKAPARKKKTAKRRAPAKRRKTTARRKTSRKTRRR